MRVTDGAASGRGGPVAIVMGLSAMLGAGIAIGPTPARMAGSAALVGLVLAGATVAGAFGTYVLPGHPALAAIGLVAFVSVLGAMDVRLPPTLITLAVGFVCVVLGLFVVVCFAIEPAGPTGAPIPPDTPGVSGPSGILVATGVMFFAFLGFEWVAASAGAGGPDPWRSERPRSP